VSDTTTPAATDSGDAGNQDWASKYNGLQRVLNRRHDELTTSQRELEQARQRSVELEQELAAYRAREAEQREEEQARAHYEALRGRFEDAPPTPRSQNARREQSGRDDFDLDQFKSSGYPI